MSAHPYPRPYALPVSLCQYTRRDNVTELNINTWYSFQTLTRVCHIFPTYLTQYLQL